MEYFIQGITTKYLDFSGRARRQEYWMFLLFSLIASFIAGFIFGFIGGFTGATMITDLGVSLIQLALLLPSLAVAVRRLHDTNRSGWWVLINFIPVIGFIVFIVFMCIEGTSGPNTYGPDPKSNDSNKTSTVENFI